MDKWEAAVLIALIVFATIVFSLLVIKAAELKQMEKFERFEKSDGVVVLNLKPGERVYAVCRVFGATARLGSYCLPVNSSVSTVNFGGDGLIVVFILKNDTLTEVSKWGGKLVINYP